MSYLKQFDSIRPILEKEGRWTPKAFERFGVVCTGGRLRIPLWKDAFAEYDFNDVDEKARKQRAHANRPKGKKATLFGNLEMLNTTLLFCEGEWDLFAAYEAGFESVVTSTNGASSLTKKELALLANRKVAIIYDVEDSGKKGAHRIATALKQPGCSIRVISLAEYVLKENGDLRDFFNAGHTHDALRNLIEGTADFLTDVENQARSNLSNILPLREVQQKAIDWCIEGLIPNGALTILTGDPGAGKSTLAAHIVSIASNGGFAFDPPLGPQMRAQKVVVFSVEDPPEQVMKPRLVRFGANEDNVFIYPEVLTLDEVGEATIREVAKEHRPGLIIIDPIVAYLGGKMDTSKANAVREKMSFLMKLAEQFQLAVLVIRHMGKASQSNGKLLYAGHGSIDFTASVRSELMLVKHPTDDNLRLFGQVKNNFGPLAGASILDFSDGQPKFISNANQSLEQLLEKLESAKSAKQNRSVNGDTRSAILEMLRHRPMRSKAFREELNENGYSYSNAMRILKNDLKDVVGRLRVSLIADKAGKGGWLTGFNEHIKIVENLQFKSASEFDDLIATKQFPTSTFQDSQENDFDY